MKKIILLTALLFSSVIFSPNANAVVSSVTASPASRNTAINQPAVVPITWRVTRTGAAGTTTVDSPTITVRWDNGNGPIVYTITKTVSQTQNVVNNVTFYMFSEAVTIPRDIVYAAAKGGHILDIQRTFTDQSDATQNTGEMFLNITGSSSADFAIQRIELAFNDGTTTCLSQPGKPHTAIATINASGTGVLHGSWQVRTGGGIGSFRTLRTVQAAVMNGRETLVQSPNLPEVNPGERLEVRLVVDSPTLGFPVPVITCGAPVKDSQFRKIDPENVAKVISPNPNSILTAETAIEWEGIKGAKSYRIEILNKEDGEALTAQMAKPDKTSGKLSPLTLDKLDPKKRYTIRVVAE